MSCPSAISGGPQELHARNGALLKRCARVHRLSCTERESGAHAVERQVRKSAAAQLDEAHRRGVQTRVTGVNASDTWFGDNSRALKAG
jgi:hypothetical protein